MSTDANDMTSEDEALLEYLEEGDESEVQATAGEADHVDPLLEERLAKMERRWEERFSEQQEVIEEQAELIETQEEVIRHLVSKVNDHDELIEGDVTDPSTNRGDLTKLERYAPKSEETRKEDLDASERRAVVIFENWTEWATTAQAGQIITTATKRGKYNTTALKVDLQGATNETLQNIEVYRAMKAVAKLSAPSKDDIEKVTDASSRVHITGGAFEYHEKPTPDGKKTRKILKLADPDAVTLP